MIMGYPGNEEELQSSVLGPFNPWANNASTRYVTLQFNSFLASFPHEAEDHVLWETGKFVHPEQSSQYDDLE